MPSPLIPLLLFLFLRLHPIAVCGAKPRHGFGHLGRTHSRPHAKPPLPNSPAVPPPPPATPWRHHVFLNFRGPDVRHAFSDHLYYALIRKGIKAFRDDRDLPRGENVTEAIPRAIEDSKLSIVVLSRGYASSEYCLDELVKIMLTMKEKGHQPFPVFYKLSPNDVVHHQSSGCYKEDFDRHKKVYSYERVKSWSHALTSIADISGWVLHSERSEAEMVENIAKNMMWKVHEMGRASDMASGASQSIRRFETGKQQQQQFTNLFICENDGDDGDGDGVVRICGRTNNGERNVSFQKFVVFDHSTTAAAAENLGSRPPPNPAGDTSTTPSPSSVPTMETSAGGSSHTDEVKNGSSCHGDKQENVTEEHDQRYQAPAASKGASREEEDGDDQKRRLWMSRTCTYDRNKNNHNHHHKQEEADQQQLKFIKPEISPQGKKTARIPRTVAQEEIKKFWDFSLIGQQLSDTSPHHHHHQNTTTLLNAANKLWNISSSNKGSWIEVKQVGTARNGLYIFTFSSQNIRDRVVESSPWCIANATFVMRKWQPNLQLASLARERSSAIPVWVRLVGVPVEYMNAKGLSYIASVLGKPLYMDRATASRSQLAFAKVCVEMRLSEKGVSTIVVALGVGDDEKDGGGNGVVVVVVRVIYQWRHCMCISCQPTTAETT
ncbi:unnamed protein product [Linum trigynum]|uniref:ADP-ribosyl cyclase/cyclic ADP-ribose hydrolase n=1 Tax=Linum trigynum TaxID=586398 RepID=A0AAV2DUG5_9ROSI